MELKIRDIIAKLEKIYPYQMAMDWDNPGLQVGRMEHPVRKVVLALDATDTVIERCVREDADLLITHHPLLMGGIRQVNEQSMAGRRILAMAENGISHFAIHTNYDTVKMGSLAGNMLGLSDTEILEVTGSTEQGPYGIGEAGLLPQEMTAEACCALVKKIFHLDGIRLFGNKEKKVRYVAISPGSGKSMIKPALALGVDLLVTGDIGHHDGIDAVDQGMLVADAGHYGIEHIFIRQMSEWIRETYPELAVIEVQDQMPFVSL